MNAMRSASRFLLFLSLVSNSVWLCKGRGGSGGKGCVRDNSFEASVLVIHEGMKFDKMETTEFEELGRLFVKAWDQMNDEDDNDWCDDQFFRNILNVTIEPQDEDVTHKSTNKRLARKTFLYTIHGGCNNNCTDYQLFAPHSDYTHPTDRDLVGGFTNTDFTDCKCGRGKKKNRGPTEDEFLLAFQKLFETANLDSVKTVYDILEYKPFECSDQQIETEEEGSLQLSEGLTGGDKKVLESGYVEAYNTLVKYFCHDADSYMSSTKFVVVKERLRTRRNLARKKLIDILSVKQRRRKAAAKKANAVIDVFTGRRLEDDNANFTYGHTCYCPLRPLAYRAPNTTEIAAAYQELLEYQAQNGELHGSYIIESMKTLMTKGELQCGSEHEVEHLGSSVGHEGTITVPDNSSCTISSGALEADFYTVLGSITVEEDAVLTITGDVTVTGMIEVKKGGTLNVAPSYQKCPILQGNILATTAKGISISSQGEDCDIAAKKMHLTGVSGPVIDIAGVQAGGEIKMENCNVDFLRLQDIDGSTNHQVVVKKGSTTGPDPTQISNINAKKIDVHDIQFTAAVDISSNTAADIWIYENDYKATFVLQNNSASKELYIKKNKGKGENSTDIVCSGNEQKDDFGDKFNDDCN